MKAERYISSVLATGIVIAPGVGMAAEADTSSPPRPLSSAKEFESKTTQRVAFEQDGQTRFGGKMTLVDLKAADPEPTPHILAQERDDRKPVIKKGLILGEPNSLGYYYMPPSNDGAYEFRDAKCTQEHWGSKRLVKDIYAVAEKWKKKYPQGELILGDLNGPAWEHASHKHGIDFDLNATTNGKDWVGNMKRGNYNQKATIELGKMIADTDTVRFVFFNDPEVRTAVNKYKGWSENERMQEWPKHEDHFHVRYDMPDLPYWAPEGKDADCGVEPGEKK